MKKYLLELLLVTMVVVAILLGYRYWSNSSSKVLSFFDLPTIGPAKVKNGYTVQIKFSDPTALHNRALRGRVITTKGEEDLGEFVVKDIRIWRPDGYRIIKDTVEVKNLPEHITISERVDKSEKVLFDADIALGKTTIKSTDPTISSSLVVTVVKQ